MGNDLLRARREATLSPSRPGSPMSRSELAEAASAHVWATTGKRCFLDGDTISRYERGQIQWPGADRRAGLRAVLGVTSDDELGFVPTRRGNTTVPKTSTGVNGKNVISAFSAADATSYAAAAPGLSVDEPASAIDDLCRAMIYAPFEPVGGNSQGQGLEPKHPLNEAFAAYQDGRFERAALHATAALQRGLEGAADPRTKALTYQVASIVLAKAGQTDLAWVAADRGVGAADASNDPRIRLTLLRTTAFVMAMSGRVDSATELIDSAARCFQPDMARTTVSASVYGTLLLTGAVINAGQGNMSRTETYLDEASQAASVFGHDRNDLWTAFGPTNVAIHKANVAAAVSDMDTVLTTGGSLHVDHMPTERRVRLHLDIARASLALGDREDALATLVRAEASAPSQVRHHRITKDVVNSLVETATRRPGVELTRLAHAVGVPA